MNPSDEASSVGIVTSPSRASNTKQRFHRGTTRRRRGNPRNVFPDVRPRTTGAPSTKSESDKPRSGDELNDLINSVQIAAQPLSSALPVSLRGIGLGVLLAYNKVHAVSNGKICNACDIRTVFRCCLAQLTARLHVTSEAYQYDTLGNVGMERFRLSQGLVDMISEQKQTLTFVANIIMGVGCFEVDKVHFNTYVPVSLSRNGVVDYTDAFGLTALNVRARLLSCVANRHTPEAQRFADAVVIPSLTRRRNNIPADIDEYFPDGWFDTEPLTRDFIAFNEFLALVEKSKAPGMVAAISYSGVASPIALPSVDDIPGIRIRVSRFQGRNADVGPRGQFVIDVPPRLPWWTREHVTTATASRGLLSLLGERFQPLPVRSAALATWTGIFTWDSLAVEAVKT